MTQKVPKKIQNKKLAYGKVPQQFEMIWGVVGHVLENTQIKAAFFVDCSYYFPSYGKITKT